MKNLCSETLKTLINELNRPGSAYKINVMYSLFGLLNDNIGNHYVTILLAKMLIWETFSQLMCTFSFGINPCLERFQQYIYGKCC